MRANTRRQITIGAVRAEARAQNLDWRKLNDMAVENILDAMHKSDPDLIAADFYMNCSSNQWKLFMREWKQEQKKSKTRRRLDEVARTEGRLEGFRANKWHNAYIDLDIDPDRDDFAELLKEDIYEENKSNSARWWQR